jgi:hypothetical protein
MSMKPNDPVRLFVSQDSGPEGYAAFFEETVGDGETPPGGYLYIKDCQAEKIVRHLEIYQRPLNIGEDDIQILWSSDGNKCGVSIWGGMRGVVDLARNKDISLPLEGRESRAITDPEWLKGFEDYLDHRQFIRARQRYWKEMARSHEPSSRTLPEEDTPLATNFILQATGPDELFAVFEDDGKTGYLYLYNVAAKKIVEHLLIYDRSDTVRVFPQDVWVGWSEEGFKCGVAVWNKMRGIIDRIEKRQGRVKLENRGTPGIDDQEWLKGFEYLYS